MLIDFCALLPPAVWEPPFQSTALAQAKDVWCQDRVHGWPIIGNSMAVLLATFVVVMLICVHRNRSRVCEYLFVAIRCLDQPVGQFVVEIFEDIFLDSSLENQHP
jgi:hypothetical protein